MFDSLSGHHQSMVNDDANDTALKSLINTKSSNYVKAVTLAGVKSCVRTVHEDKPIMVQHL